MWRNTLLSLAAAAAVGALGLTGTAAAMPLAPAVHAIAGMDLAVVQPVHSVKPRYHYGKPSHYHYRRPGVVISFALLPGFYYGPYYHPRYHYHPRAPYHCHRWKDRYGHWHKRCHRHW